MPDWSKLSLFISVTAALVFMPGPNTLYIIARSVQQGRRAGVVSSLGVQTGSLVHIAAAALGLSALLMSSALAFGVVINLLNPKTALFFFAFLPQFVDASRGSVGMQIVSLGMILVFLGTLSDMLYALAAGGVGNLLRGNLKVLRAQRYFAGSVYLGLGAATAFSGTHNK